MRSGWYLVKHTPLSELPKDKSHRLTGWMQGKRSPVGFGSFHSCPIRSIGVLGLKGEIDFTSMTVYTRLITRAGSHLIFSTWGLDIYLQVPDGSRLSNVPAA